MKTCALLTLLLTCTSCSLFKEYIYIEPRQYIIKGPSPPVFAPILEDNIDCLDGKVRVAFWSFYTRVGEYVKELHRVIELYNKWATEKNMLLKEGK